MLHAKCGVEASGVAVSEQGDASERCLTKVLFERRAHRLRVCQRGGFFSDALLRSLRDEVAVLEGGISGDVSVEQQDRGRHVFVPLRLRSPTTSTAAPCKLRR